MFLTSSSHETKLWFIWVYKKWNQRSWKKENIYCLTILFSICFHGNSVPIPFCLGGNIAVCSIWTSLNSFRHGGMSSPRNLSFWLAGWLTPSQQPWMPLHALSMVVPFLLEEKVCCCSFCGSAWGGQPVLLQSRAVLEHMEGGGASENAGKFVGGLAG